MLVVSRKLGEEIVIDDQVRVRIVAIGGKRVRLAIEAPKSVPVHREEIHRRNIENESSSLSILPAIS